MNENLILQYFGEIIKQMIGNNKESMMNFYVKLEAFEKSFEWRVLYEILKHLREQTIQILESTTDLSQENLISLRERLAAIDFFLNTPENLKNTIKYVTQAQEITELKT